MTFLAGPYEYSYRKKGDRLLVPERDIEAANQRIAELEAENKRLNELLRTGGSKCWYCDKEFQQKIKNYNNNYRKYCSDECKNAKLKEQGLKAWAQQKRPGADRQDRGV